MAGSPQTSTQSTTSNQNSSSDTGPANFIQPYLQGGVGALASNFAANPNAPGYFPGSTVAPQSPDTQAALNATYAYGMGGGAPRIGPMAQDVEELHPEAVSTHPSGFKIVDFAAMPVGGLM